MHLDRGLLGWGAFLVTLGSVPLAVRAGYLDPAFAGRAWELWPLVLVGLGLGLLLRRTRIAVVGGLVVAVTFGAIGGGLLAGGRPPGGFDACAFGAGSDTGSPFATQTGTFGPEARVGLDLSCGELSARGADGTGWTVGGTADGGRAPEIRSSGDRLAVRSAEQHGIALGVRGSSWDVTLPRQVSLALDVSVNAGSARLNLASLRVPDLDISVNAGDATVWAFGLVEAGSVSASVNAGSLVISLPVPTSDLGGSLSVNAGSIEVCVPDGVGLRIRMDGGALGSNNYDDRGLVRAGDTWTRPGFDTAAQQIELSVSANLGSITLNPESGCE